MEKPINMLMLDFKKDILTVINSEEYKILPMLMKQMLCGEIQNKLEEVTANVINNEIKGYNEYLANEKEVKDGDLKDE